MQSDYNDDWYHVGEVGDIPSPRTEEEEREWQQLEEKRQQEILEEEKRQQERLEEEARQQRLEEEKRQQEMLEEHIKNINDPYGNSMANIEVDEKDSKYSKKRNQRQSGKQPIVAVQESYQRLPSGLHSKTSLNVISEKKNLKANPRMLEKQIVNIENKLRNIRLKGEKRYSFVSQAVSSNKHKSQKEFPMNVIIRANDKLRKLNILHGKNPSELPQNRFGF